MRRTSNEAARPMFLNNDPHGMVNLAGNPDYGAIKGLLYRHLWAFAAEHDKQLQQLYLERSGGLWSA